MDAGNEQIQNAETPIRSASTSTISTLGNIDVNSNLQGGGDQSIRMSTRGYLVRVYTMFTRELGTYSHPGLKRDLASWTGVAFVVTSLVMYVRPFARLNYYGSLSAVQ
jgi:hypothetical protein